jgi:hypothetical protein
LVAGQLHPEFLGAAPAAREVFALPVTVGSKIRLRVPEAVDGPVLRLAIRDPDRVPPHEPRAVSRRHGPAHRAVLDQSILACAAVIHGTGILPRQYGLRRATHREDRADAQGRAGQARRSLACPVIQTARLVPRPSTTPEAARRRLVVHRQVPGRATPAGGQRGGHSHSVHDTMIKPGPHSCPFWHRSGRTTGPAAARSGPVRRPGDVVINTESYTAPWIFVMRGAYYDRNHRTAAMRPGSVGCVRKRPRLSGLARKFAGGQVQAVGSLR